MGDRGASGTRGVFTHEQAAALAEADTEHWWFGCKASIVNALLRRSLGDGLGGGLLVDVGAGGGGVTRRLRWPGGLVVAVEGNQSLAAQAQAHSLPVVMARGDELPLASGEATAATLLDVLEHQTEPGRLLREVHRLVKPGGLVVVTVPGHRWLWSRADELLGHVKRYTVPTLNRELAEAGFHVRVCTHVFSWLVPPVWLHRRLRRDTAGQLGLSTASPALGLVARALTSLELVVIRRLRLPLGSSVAAVAVRT